MVNLTDQEWGQVMGLLSEAPWKIANPLLMKVGEQLRMQHGSNPLPHSIKTNSEKPMEANDE
jgi:hypothetical protein